MKFTYLGLMLSLSGAIAASAQGPDDLVELKRRAQADSNDPVAHFHLAAAYFRASQYEEAANSLREAITIDPQFAPALLLLARTRWMQTGGVVDLIARTNDGLPSPAAHVPFLLEIPRLTQRAFMIDPLLELFPVNREHLPMAWRETLSRALRDHDRGRLRDALAGFQKVIDRTARKDSTSVPPVVLWLHARSALSLKEFDTAIADLRWLVALAVPDTTPGALVRMPFAGDQIRYVVAYVHQQAGRLEEAKGLYQELLERHLGLYMAHAHLAAIHEQQGQWALAVAERRRALAAHPEDASLQFDLGSTLAYAGEYAEAEEQLEAYARTNPRESRAHYLLGFVRMRAGDSVGARVALTRYLELAPSRFTEQISDARARLRVLP